MATRVCALIQPVDSWPAGFLISDPWVAADLVISMGLLSDPRVAADLVLSMGLRESETEVL